MAEEAPAPVSPTPEATSSPPGPGPVSSGTPPGPASESAAPAAFPPPTEAAAVTEPAPTPEPTTPEPAAAPSSILSDAKADEKPPAEAAKEAPAEKPAEAPAAAPTYEAFNLPEGVALDTERLAGFGQLLGEFETKLTADPATAHATMQEMGQKMVDLHIQEMQEAANRMARLQKDNWDRVTESWLQEFRDDPEMGGNRQQTTVQRMGALLNLYGQNVGPDMEAKAREAFAITGAGNNPHVLRLFNWMANRLVERPRPVPAVVPRPPVAPTTRAQRMYRNSGNGAA